MAVAALAPVIACRATGKNDVPRQLSRVFPNQPSDARSGSSGESVGDVLRIRAPRRGGAMTLVPDSLLTARRGT